MRNQQLLLFHIFQILDDQSITFYSDSPFTLALNLSLSSTIDFSNKLQYCTTKNYTTLTPNTTISAGYYQDTYYIKLRGNNIPFFANSTTNFSYFVLNSDKPIYCTGNILNLLNYQNTKSIVLPNYCFYKLFYNCGKLVSAPELPSKKVSKFCYCQMFYGCGLLETPELPATTLDTSCYEDMFRLCKSIKIPTELNATKLPEACYKNMFNGCTGIYLYKDTVFPDIYKIPYSETSSSSTTSSLENMFSNTSGDIQGTIDVDTIYYYDKDGGKDESISVRFYNNDNEPFTFSIKNKYLKTPEDLDGYWYPRSSETPNPLDEVQINSNIQIWYSFDNKNFTQYTYNTEITTDGPNLYLQGRENTGLGPIGMIKFSSGSISVIGNLIKLIDYTVNTKQDYTLKYSEYQFASLFYNNKFSNKAYYQETMYQYGNYITDISQLIIPPVEESTDISGAHFFCMFFGCSKLTSDKLMKEIPCNTYTSNLQYEYANMFAFCTSLSSIPSTFNFSGGNNGLTGMFYGCSSLLNIPDNFINSMNGSYCCTAMFAYCTSLKSIPENIFSNITRFYDGSFQCMFYNCSSLTSVPDNIFSSMSTAYYPSGVKSYANSICAYMFYKCTSILTLGNIFPSDIIAVNAFAFMGMFYKCTSLTSIPINLLYNITIHYPDEDGYNIHYSLMFTNCTNLQNPCYINIQGTCLANTPIAQRMFAYTKVKVSETRSSDYNKLYRVPIEGTFDVSGFPLTSHFFGDMFDNTPGPISGSGYIYPNTDYWLYSPVTPTKYKTVLYSPVDVNSSSVTFRAWKSCYYAKSTETIEVENGTAYYPNYQKIDSYSNNILNYEPQTDKACTESIYTEVKDPNPPYGTASFYQASGDFRTYYEYESESNTDTSLNKYLSSVGILYDNAEDVPTSVTTESITKEQKEIIYSNRTFTDDLIIYTMELPDTHSFEPNSILSFSTYYTAPDLQFPLVQTSDNKYYTGTTTYALSNSELNTITSSKVILSNPHGEVKYSAVQPLYQYKIFFNRNKFTDTNSIVYISGDGSPETIESLYTWKEETYYGTTYKVTNNTKTELLTGAPEDTSVETLLNNVYQYIPKDPYISDTSLFVDPAAFNRQPTKVSYTSDYGTGSISIGRKDTSQSDSDSTYKPFYKYTNAQENYSLSAQDIEFSSESSGTHIVGICVKDSEGKMRLICNVDTEQISDGTYVRSFVPARTIEKYNGFGYITKQSYNFSNTPSDAMNSNGTFYRVPDLDTTGTLDGVYYQEYEAVETYNTETHHIHYGNSVADLNNMVNAKECPKYTA